MQLECVGTVLFIPGVSPFSWVMLMSAALIIQKKAYFVGSSGVFGPQRTSGELPHAVCVPNVNLSFSLAACFIFILSPFFYLFF